jgi:L-gulonate 5-dehydrogenase
MWEAVTTGRRAVRVREAPEPPAPGPGEALVAVAAVGICGSDIAMWAGTDPYATFPVRQGHEFSGRIVAMGPGYEGPLEVGQLAAVEPLLPDWTCGACRRGHPNCCVALRVIGVHADGALADGLLVPTRNLHAADDLTPELAAFVEPISIGLHMVERSRLGVGDSVVVFGAGPIGQAVLLAASDRGARTLVVDVVPGRLSRARENGAEATVDAASDDVSAAIGTWTGGEGPTVVFEATGVASVLRQAIDVAAHAGTVVVAGTSNDDVEIPSLALVRKELNILGSRNSVGAYEAAIGLVRRYRARCEALITQRFALPDVDAAFRLGESEPAVANKMMIMVGG